MEKRNSQCEHDSKWSEQEVCFARATQVWLAVNHNTSQANEFDVRSEKHGQVSMAAVNQIVCGS